MFSELKTEPKTPRQRTTDYGVRLNPVPAKNTLLTIIFFSAIAAAMLYWLFSPPAPQQAADSSPVPNTQAAERN